MITQNCAHPESKGPRTKGIQEIPKLIIWFDIALIWPYVPFRGALLKGT